MNSHSVFGHCGGFLHMGPKQEGTSREVLSTPRRDNSAVRLPLLLRQSLDQSRLLAIGSKSIMFEEKPEELLLDE